MTEKLATNKCPVLWLYTDSWVVANGFAVWSGKWGIDNWMIKGVLLFGKLYVNSKGKPKRAMLMLTKETLCKESTSWYLSLISSSGNLCPRNELTWGNSSHAAMFQMQNTPVALIKVQSVNNYYSVCHQERQCLQLALGSVPKVKGPAHSWLVDNIDPSSIASEELGYWQNLIHILGLALHT